MPKVILDNIAAFTQTAITTINQNSDKIEAAIENTLSRDGTTPNQMEADLDMNHNDILNVNEIDVNKLYVDGVLVVPGNVVEAPTALSIYYDNTASGLSEDTVQEAIDELAEKSLSFPTKAIAETFSPSSAPLYVRTQGYSLVGDGGEALYRQNGTTSGDLVLTLSTGISAGYDAVESSLVHVFDSLVDFENANMAKPISVYVQSDEPGGLSEFKNVGTVDPVEPGQAETTVAGVTHFYTRSNKVLRPQQFGCKTGGDPADNRAALLELFASARDTGRTIDMGDANDLYEIDDTITFDWTTNPTIRSDGAKIKLNRGGAAAVTFGVRFYIAESADIEGFVVGGNFETPNPFWIEGYAASAAEGSLLRLVGVGGENGYRATNSDFAGRNLSINGWFERLVGHELYSGEIKMGDGAVSPGTHGVVGIFIGVNSSNQYPIHKELSNLYTGKVWCEDATNLVDMDAVSILDASPSGNNDRLPGTLSIVGGTHKDAHGRFMKIRVPNASIINPSFIMNSAPTGGRVAQLVDFQLGAGSLRGAQAFCNGASFVTGVNAFARTYAAGNVVVDDLRVTGRGSAPDIDCLLYRFSEASHLPGSAALRNSSTEWVQALYLCRFNSRLSNAERALVEGNAVRSLASGGAGVYLEGSGTVRARFMGNANHGSARASYDVAGGVTPNVQGNDANSNTGFSVVT